MNLLEKKRGLWVAIITLMLCLLTTTSAFAQGTAVLIGSVTDAATKAPVADVVVTATSPALQGEQLVVTDKSGLYRIPNLPPGDYTLRLEKEAYRLFEQKGIGVRAASTIRVNVLLRPESLRAEEIVIVGSAPTIDVGSSSTGVTVDSKFTDRIAVSRPTGRGGATKSFESVAEVAPGASGDLYGTSINGTTSPENGYNIDGLSVGNPGYGINGTPLTIDFIDEVNVVTGGYLPEYGRATGGILDVTTKSGGNEFHGSLWGDITPGIFEGPREPVIVSGTTITTDYELSSIRSFGFDLGGPIVKDKLWFYVGFSPSFSTYNLERNLNKFQVDASGAPIEINGITQTDRIPGTQKFFNAEERTFQYIGKLTLNITPDHNVSLSVYGSPTSSGGNGAYGFDYQDGRVETLGGTGNLNGQYNALAHRFTSNANDVALTWSSAFDNKKKLFDATLGWHHQYTARLPSDGSELGSQDGLAGVPLVVFRRAPNWHSITDFESVPADAGCDPPGTEAATLCPINTYSYGGPDFIDEATLNRFQLKAKVTTLFEALGHHVVKVGIDFEQMSYDHIKAYSGGVRYRESLGGASFFEPRQYGYLTGPDEYFIQDAQRAQSTSSNFGVFVQDSWSIADKVTLNLGVRYDAQYLFGDDGKLGLALPNEWSPRIGVVYDFTQQGRSKLFANYARYYESIPLDLVDRAFPGERQIGSNHIAASCDPRDVSQHRNECQLDSNRRQLNGNADPNQKWAVVGSDPVPVDPDILPQSSDELVLGGELEVLPNGRIGVSYTKRWMNHVIEDMSRDEGATYFIGNPGHGIAEDFPEGERDYDAVTFYLQKAFADTWLAQASYTASYLRGNLPGLFRPETQQLDPNINSDFDLQSLLPNRNGPLPGDSTHQIKIYGAKDIPITKDVGLQIGLTYRTRSGAPLSVTGSHLTYGANEVFILPRGAGERMPWVHDIDSHLGVGFQIAKDSALTLGIDIFNLFNFQEVTRRDQTYTNQDVLPIANGTKEDIQNGLLRNADGTPFDQRDRNPNYDKPVEYQPPRTIRLGAKVTF